MKLKKYNEYVKEDLTSMSSEVDPTELELDNEMEIGQEEQFDDDLIDDEINIDNQIDDEPEEEEGREYEGTKLMKDLAAKLGSEIVNNSIQYNGKKINFFSETESFHIDKKKFKTIDEVLNYLGQY